MNKRSVAARAAAIGRIPTEPHPDNLKLVPHPVMREGLPFAEWFHKRVAEMLAPPCERSVSFVAWCSTERLADGIQAQLDDHMRHPDGPLSPKAVRQLRAILKTLRLDLDRTRPF